MTDRKVGVYSTVVLGRRETSPLSSERARNTACTAEESKPAIAPIDDQPSEYAEEQS